MAAAPFQSKAQWYNDCIDAAIDDVIAVAGGPAWTEAGFARLVSAARRSVPEQLARLAPAVARIAESVHAVTTMFDRLDGSAVDVSVRDARAHLGRLAYPGFVAGVGVDRLDDVARYIEAIRHRVEHLTDNPARDLTAAAECVEVEGRHCELVAELGLTSDLEEVTWLLEELRVSAFAQHLRGPVKVSATRIDRKLGQIARTAGL